MCNLHCVLPRTMAAGAILLSNTGRRWGEKHYELVSAERGRGHLALLIVTEPWQWTERSLCVSCLLFPPPSQNPPHLPPTPTHPSHQPQYLMKYVQGKQRWGWCADLPPPWLTATCPVPLLIYKACRVSARVASLASLPRHKGTFITPCLHFNHQEEKW